MKKALNNPYALLVFVILLIFFGYRTFQVIQRSATSKDLQSFCSRIQVGMPVAALEIASQNNNFQIEKFTSLGQQSLTISPPNDIKIGNLCRVAIVEDKVQNAAFEVSLIK